jgi:hypothetical protein
MSKKSLDQKELEKSYQIPIEKYKRKPGDLKIQLQVIEARHLHKVDLFKGTSAYTCLYCLSEVQPRAHTNVIKKNLSPQWNEMLEA